MINLQGDTSKLAGYAGAVGGVLDAVGSPSFNQEFQKHTLGQLRRKFTQHAIVSRNRPDIQHMFEWGDQDSMGVAVGGPSPIPLFKLVIRGGSKAAVLSYTVLPSTKPVPLPDPAKYGFSSDKLEFLTRHEFTWKAIVMETRSKVILHGSKTARGLFIPTGVTAETPQGYVMTKKDVEINPGGAQATGGFARFWTEWFGTTAQSELREITKKTEQHIAATGQKVIRHTAGTVIDGRKMGGKFAKAQKYQMGFADASRRNAELMTQAELKKRFESDGENTETYWENRRDDEW